MKKKTTYLTAPGARYPQFGSVFTVEALRKDIAKYLNKIGVRDCEICGIPVYGLVGPVVDVARQRWGFVCNFVSQANEIVVVLSICSRLKEMFEEITANRGPTDSVFCLVCPLSVAVFPTIGGWSFATSISGGYAPKASLSAKTASGWALASPLDFDLCTAFHAAEDDLLSRSHRGQGIPPDGNVPTLQPAAEISAANWRALQAAGIRGMALVSSDEIAAVPMGSSSPADTCQNPIPDDQSDLTFPACDKNPPVEEESPKPAYDTNLPRGGFF